MWYCILLFGLCLVLFLVFLFLVAVVVISGAVAVAVLPHVLSGWSYILLVVSVLWCVIFRSFGRPLWWGSCWYIKGVVWVWVPASISIWACSFFVVPADLWSPSVLYAMVSVCILPWLLYDSIHLFLCLGDILSWSSDCKFHSSVVVSFCAYAQLVVVSHLFDIVSIFSYDSAYDVAFQVDGETGYFIVLLLFHVDFVVLFCSSIVGLMLFSFGCCFFFDFCSNYSGHLLLSLFDEVEFIIVHHAFLFI